MKKKNLIFLNELKSRILKVAIFFVLSLFLAGIFSNQIFSFLLNNLNAPSNVSLIISSPNDSVLLLVDIIFFTAIILSLPILFYQILMFIKPALTKKEKFLLFLFLCIFLFLFIWGIIFGFFITKFILVPFLSNLTAGTSVLNMWGIFAFMKFFIVICLLMGLTFQIPLIVMFLVKFGIISTKELASFRKYVLIGILVFVAIVTPNGDPFSLLIVSLPLFLLFEISLLLSRVIKKKHKIHE